MNQPFELENLTAELQSQIEERCEDFEQSWQNGENPSLEKTLFDFTNPSRSILLKELILIERYYRLRETGKIISEQELLAAHPEIAEELSAIFADSHSARTRIADQSDSGSADSSGSLTVKESRLHFEQFPARFGRYQILSRLGEGGMGCVYLARDTQLERKVALKLPQINSHADTQFISRFYREARAAANLNHPNLCSVYDVDQIDDVHYITMEFIEGESLAALIQAGQKFSQREIVQLIQQLAQALELAHQQGIVHRDLKPANIMIRQDGTPIITDFGLAMMSQNEEATQITQHGQIMGSPSYMSPEQVEGDLEIIGPASDVYSLGVIMYELLAGQRPFQGSTASILSQIMTKDPRPVRNIQPDIDSRLDQICRKMMARSTELRYDTMQEVSQVLSTWQESSLSGTSAKRLSPGRILVGMALAAVLLLGISFLRPSSSQGTLHVTLNDQRALILLDGKPLDLTSGSWTGTQKSGSHELSLQIGDQRLPWGELTTVKSEGNEQRVLASVNGVPLKNGRFEIVPNTTESAEIKLSWLPVTQIVSAGETKHPVKNQSEPPRPETDETTPFAKEREITEWLIGLGGIVRFNMAHDFKFGVKDIESLPDEPFRLKSITFRESNNVNLPDLSRLSQIRTLEELSLKNVQLTPAALKGLRFYQAFETLRIIRTPLKTSDLQAIQGLEYIDTLELSGSQIDDQFDFLKQMTNLRALEITDISPAALQELSQSQLLSQSKLRFLRLRSIGQFDEPLIQRLQTARPGMTITSNGPGRKEEYLGNPVTRLAAEKLIKLGCTLKGHEPGRGEQTYSKENLPSDRTPFTLLRVTLPPEMKLTPEVTELLAALPIYFQFKAIGMKNADLLTEVPNLRLASGVDLFESDLTDDAFKILVYQDPDGYFNVEGTKVSESLVRQLDRDAPYVAFNSNYRKGLRWLEVLYEENRTAKQNQLKPTETDAAPLSFEEQIAFEREVAEWVIGLGGRIHYRLTNGGKSTDAIASLPDEPFLVSEIHFENAGKKKLKLPDMSRLNRLLALQALDVSECKLEPGALAQLRFGDMLTTLNVDHTSLKSSELKTIQGLEFLDTFDISSSQIDDDFLFLEQMPDLRALWISKASLELLQKLAGSPFLSHSKLRFLRIEFDDEIDESLIERLQSACPGMTIIAADLIDHRKYLGTPYARLAADRLLDLGCSIRANEFERGVVNYTKEVRPSKTVPFRAVGIKLPPDLALTPEIVADLTQLPAYYGLVGDRVKNADLLADVPVLKRCAGIHLMDSDLTDEGFEALVRTSPYCYFHIKGTQVSSEMQQRIDREFPLISFHGNSRNGQFWLKDRVPFPDTDAAKSTAKQTDEEQIAIERETAEWVINLGGRVSFKKAQGTDYLKNRLDQLPEEPLRVIDIDFSRPNQKIKFPSLSHLSRLVTLHTLNIMNCNLEPGALEGLQFNEYAMEFHIYNTPLKTSDLTSHMGLEHLDTFKLGAVQIDDQFRFLDLMPRLRNLHLYSPVPQTLEDLARAPGFAKMNLRFLNITSNGRKYEPELITELQKIQPGMSVIDTDSGSINRYMGTPVARQAAIRLLDLGITINAKNKIFDKSEYPPESELFVPGRVNLPADLEVTPEIVEAISQLPVFFGLEASGVRNADLLTGIPVLRRCGGIQIPESDLSDQGFEALIKNHPDGYVNATGTKVSREKAKQLNRDFPYAAFHTDYLEGKRWLNALNKPKLSPSETTTTAPSDREREIAGWVIEQGGYLKCTQQSTGANFSQILPATPFRVLMIDFRSSTKKPLTLPNLDRLNQLKGLQFLKLSECLIDLKDFKKYRLGQYLKTLVINDSSLKTSDFRTVLDQEYLDTFELSGSQIDDDFQFLEQMSNLRRLRLKNPAIQTLEKLANSPYLVRSQLRFLELEFDGEIESKLIQQLQSAGPRLTILGIDLKKQSRYLGTPYAKQAADRLLDLGCTFNGSQPTKGPQIFSKDQHPSESFPFQVGGFSFPSGLEITPEIVADLSQLPGPFVGLVANGVKNADLLADVRLLKHCGGIRLENSDVTDTGFEAFVRRSPDCDFYIAGTQISEEKLNQLNQEFPYATSFADFGDRSNRLETQNPTTEDQSNPDQ